MHVFDRESSYKPSPQSTKQSLVEAKKNKFTVQVKHFVTESSQVSQGDRQASHILLMPINSDGQAVKQLSPLNKKYPSIHVTQVPISEQLSHGSIHCKH